MRDHVELEDAGTGVASLVVTGADAPTRLRIAGRATINPEDAAAYLDDVAPEVLADAQSDEWRDIVADTAMHDMGLRPKFSQRSTVEESTGVERRRSGRPTPAVPEQHMACLSGARRRCRP